MKIILVVDDEIDIAKTLEMVLTSEGYGVRIANNGEEALECLREDPMADLIITDIMMPVMDGYRFLTALRSYPQYLRIPVILTSAGQLDLRQVRAEDYGRFLRKPYDLDLLLVVIDEMIKAA